jgi:hypothetical protein
LDLNKTYSTLNVKIVRLLTKLHAVNVFREK